MIQRGMKSQIAHGDSVSQRHTERLDSAIQILIIDRVFIMPNSCGRIRHLVCDEGTTIGSRDGLDCVYGRSSPGIDGGDCSKRGPDRGKGETRCAADIETAVRRVAVHVALPSVGLAPGVFMRSDVLRFGVIGRAWIQRRVQVAPLHQKPVRDASFSVARVLRCARWEGTGKGIHPGARTQATLSYIQARTVRVRTSYAKMRAARGGGAAKTASVLLQSGEGVLQPGLADLLKAIVVGRSTAHPIQILRNDGMVRI